MSRTRKPRIPILALLLGVGLFASVLAYTRPITPYQASKIALQRARREDPNAEFDLSESEVKWMPQDKSWAVSLYDHGATRVLYKVTPDGDCFAASRDDWLGDDF